MHSIKRLPGARIITGLLWAILLAGLLAWLAPRFMPSLADLTPEPEVKQQATLSVLRSQELMFMVSRRTASQIVVEHEESSWLGEWRGVLWGVVRLHFGVDLTKIKAKNIRREGDVSVVTLPEPEILDFAVEPGSIGFMSKSTAVAKVEDLLHNGQRRLLENRLQQCAMDFARQRDMLPSRAELVEQLNDAVSLLASEGGVRLRFE